MNKIFKKIEKMIKKYESIVIFHHVRPDGDCLGSQFGLKELIKDNFPNKKIFAIGNSENLFDFLDFKMDEVPSKEILKNSLGIIVDANYLERIEHSEIIKNQEIKEVIRIDHHPEDDDLNASLVFKDDSYAASAEQIGDLAIKLKWKISKKAAEYIYLGIITDSGRFLFNKTSSRTFSISSTLLKSKIDLDKFNLNLYKKTLSELKEQQIVLSNLKISGNILYFKASKEFLQIHKIDEKIANYVNLLSNIENYYVWIFFIEDEKENIIRIRLRSSGPNISDVAKKFNGGGHFRASGAKIKSFDEIENVLEESQKAIDFWLNEQKVQKSNS
ncbi:DHH family phosphoesterase [[Mycoplasma] mobile]|uniref:Mgpa-like protein n=1 Tax=Mycoplasma mobile (strain ATCC 43663 / 163K / NCTC 11711) TaxID=267748 RepID=Q6KIM3_MYCM1|nr:bifunctional oligoribonuclease/PAP phosphatase NrnA [[Mycoplasma] mobile]AAT27553.1 mgpa-like protein [Mycoplasma mobile 163K]